MECYIHPKIDYNNISSRIKQQKQVSNLENRLYKLNIKVIINLLKSLCINHIKFPGVSDKIFEKLEENKNKDGLIDFDLIKQIPGIGNCFLLHL